MLCLLVLLPAGWMHEEKHPAHFTDAFRMSAPEPVDRVTASLNLKAYNLLREEFPLTDYPPWGGVY